MTGELSPPAPPPPETVDQALALLLKAMKEGEPSDEEGLAIEPSMTHLDRLAWCHQVAGEALQLAAQTRAALFRRRRNAFIPFNRLPSEVLSAILLEAVDESQPLRIKALQVLAQVAWQWWQTIKSDPQFWAYITPPVEGVELQLRKAGALPLRLGWSDDTDPDAFKDIIQRHAKRWTSINVNCHGEDAGLQALCTSHFPRLRYLKVHPSPWIIRGDLKFNISQCQSLQEAHLPIMPYFSASLSSTSPMHLRTLHLDLRSLESHSSQDLEPLLRLTPQLVELKVENSFDDTSPRVPVDAPIIDLPKLRHLEFANIFSREEEEWIPLLAQIRASQLENLGLHYNHSFHRWAPDIARRTIFTVTGRKTTFFDA
ncbi:hypothetical protein FRC04_004201 [Tulasnella sp. 424]|nr:hypothetical protein FRC04_004201 [Tulasnella sp. 424]